MVSLVLKAYYNSYRLTPVLGKLVRACVRLVLPNVESLGVEAAHNSQLLKSLIKQMPGMCTNRPAFSRLYIDCFNQGLAEQLGVGIHKLRSVYTLDDIEGFVSTTYLPSHHQGVGQGLTVLTAYVNMLYYADEVIKQLGTETLTPYELKLHVAKTHIAHVRRFMSGVHGDVVLISMGLTR